MAEAARDRIAFAALRLAARTRIARGRPLPPLGPATYLTAIARVPADLGARLAGVATELPAPAGAFV